MALIALLTDFGTQDHYAGTMKGVVLGICPDATIVDISHDQLRAAAQLRAATGVKTPDALQLVAAIGDGCTTFLTNDRRLPPVPGLRLVDLTSSV